MTTQNATSQDFATWSARARSLSVDSLIYIVADCQAAAAAMATHPAPNREGFYLDQAMTYADELRRRRKP